jgi:hypothetical protein
MKKLVTCEHCGGKKMCTISGGKSCRDCLAAAGKGLRDFATVRCSYCGGRGKVWVEEEDEDEDAAANDDE